MKDFFKRLGAKMQAVSKKMFGWLLESNRATHSSLCILIFILTMVMGAVLWEFTQDVYLVLLVMAWLACLVGSAAVELIQHISKIGKWDWLDIAAGMLYPSLIVAISLFAYVWDAMEK